MSRVQLSVGRQGNFVRQSVACLPECLRRAGRDITHKDRSSIERAADGKAGLVHHMCIDLSCTNVPMSQ